MANHQSPSHPQRVNKGYHFVFWVATQAARKLSRIRRGKSAPHCNLRHELRTQSPTTHPRCGRYSDFRRRRGPLVGAAGIRDLRTPSVPLGSRRKPTDNEVADLVRESRADKLTEISTHELRERQRARLARKERDLLQAMCTSRRCTEVAVDRCALSVWGVRSSIFSSAYRLRGIMRCSRRLCGMAGAGSSLRN